MGRSIVIMIKEIKLSEEEAEQLWNEIESEGFGYWVEHYGYDGEEDPELVQLCKEARAAMEKLREHIDAIFEHYDIG
jgi:hypothetical protein